MNISTAENELLLLDEYIQGIHSRMKASPNNETKILPDNLYYEECFEKLVVANNMYAMLIKCISEARVECGISDLMFECEALEKENTYADEFMHRLESSSIVDNKYITFTKDLKQHIYEVKRKIHSLREETIVSLPNELQTYLSTYHN